MQDTHITKEKDMTENTALSTETDTPELPALSNTNFQVYFNVQLFEHVQRVAKMFAASTIVPDQYKNQQSNCFIAIQMATRMNMDPMTFMQKSFIIKGKPGIEAQVGIAALNNSGLIKGRINYEIEGEGAGKKCTAFVYDKETGERYEYPLLLSDALKVGMAGQNPNWKAIPDLMLKYRSATYLIRAHYPDVLLGMQTKEELQDVHGQFKDVTPAKRDNSDLKDRFTTPKEEKKEEPKRIEVIQDVPLPFDVAPQATEEPVKTTPLTPEEMDALDRQQAAQDTIT